MLSPHHTLINAAWLIGSLFIAFAFVHIITSLLKKSPIPWDRILSQIFLYALILGVLALPPIFLVGLLTLLILIGVREIYQTLRVKDVSLYLPGFEIFSLITCGLVPWFFMYIAELFPLYLVMVTITLVSVPVFLKNPTESLAKTIPPALSLIFTCLLSFLLWIRILPEGLGLCIFLIFLTNATDSMAFVFGKMLGRIKIAPHLSPQKTLEGTLLSILSTLAFAALAHYIFLPGIFLWKLLILAGLIGIIAHLGDLVLSIYKRDAGIKDYGTLIPGHGGILDRFDSLILTTPLFYYAWVFINP